MDDNLKKYDKETCCGIKIGQEFERLKVLEFYFKKMKGYNYFAKCICKCGNYKTTKCSSLKRMRTKSCGCLQKDLLKTHGMSKSKIFNTWQHMSQRCYNPKAISFKYYGAIGISVCDEWRESFSVFYEWCLQNGWKDNCNLSIERKNPHKNYEPDNCCFIPKPDQGKNKRNTRLILAFGENKTMAEWSRDSRCLVKYATLRMRIDKYGQKPEVAMTTPLRENRRKK